MKIQLLTTLLVGGMLLCSHRQSLGCGDANNDHALSISDVIYGMQYLFNGGPPLANFDTGDFDNYAEWTMNDAYGITMCSIVDCWPSAGTCPPGNPPLNPPVTDGFRLRHTAAFPKVVSHIVFDLALDVAQSVSGFQLPLRILVEGGDTAVIDSVKYQVWTGSQYWVKFATVAADRQTLVLGASGLLFSVVDDPVSLARLYVSAPPAPESRVLTLEFADYVPPQAPPEHQVPIAPMLVGYSGVWKPSIYGTCCLVPGDADGGGSTSIADVVFIINYTFAAGPLPEGCILLGDADGNGSLSIGDAVWLINYIFNGGRPPMCR